MNRQSHDHSPLPNRSNPASRPPPSAPGHDDVTPRTEACRLSARPGAQSATDRPDLNSLKLLQQHQVRRADPGRDQQQRDHQRGWC